MAAREFQSCTVTYDFSHDFDLIVIGCGLSGLLAARNSARIGLRVLILEASPRSGGRIRSYNMKNMNGIVDLGSELIHSVFHKNILDEIKHYSLTIENIDSDTRNCWSFCEGQSISGDSCVPVTVPFDIECYNKLLVSILADARSIRFRSGFDQLNIEYLDEPFDEYVQNRLKAIGAPKEALLSRAEVLMGSHSNLFSAYAFLRNVSGYCCRDDETSISIQSFLTGTFARLKFGLESLVNCVLEDFMLCGGEIAYNSPVVEVSDIENLNIHYDMNSMSAMKPTKAIQVRKLDGTSFLGRGVVVCVPMKCLASIKFQPQLPVAITRALPLCNVGNMYKSWGIHAGVSRSVDRVGCWGGGGVLESQVKHRLSATHSTQAVSSVELVTESTEGTTCAVDTSTEGDSGSGEKATGQQSQQSYIIVPEHLSTACIQPTRVSGEVSVNIRRSQQRRHIRNKNSGCGEADSFSMLHAPPIQALLTAPQTSHFALVRTISSSNFHLANGLEYHKALRCHHPTLVTPADTSSAALQASEALVHYDFSSDCWARGTSFCLKAGTSKIFAKACSHAQKPWSHTDAFIISGGDFCGNGWTGWVDGSVSMGNDSGNRIAHYLKPPRPVQNYLRIIHRKRLPDGSEIIASNVSYGARPSTVPVKPSALTTAWGRHAHTSGL